MARAFGMRSICRICNEEAEEGHAASRINLALRAAIGLVTG